MVGALHRNASSDLSRAEVGGLLGVLLRGPSVSSATLPGDFGEGGTWIPDRTALRELIGSQFSDPADPRNLAVGIVNVGAPDGSARRLRARLEAAGYQRVSIVDEPRTPQARTTLSGGRAAAGAVQADLGYGSWTAQESAAGMDVTVRLGADAK